MPCLQRRHRRLHVPHFHIVRTIVRHGDTQLTPSLPAKLMSSSLWWENSGLSRTFSGQEPSKLVHQQRFAYLVDHDRTQRETHVRGSYPLLCRFQPCGCSGSSLPACLRRCVVGLEVRHGWLSHHSQVVSYCSASSTRPVALDDAAPPYATEHLTLFDIVYSTLQYSVSGRYIPKEISQCTELTLELVHHSLELNIHAT